MEDLEGQVALVDAQLAAVESQKSSVHAEQKTLELQLAQVEDQIARTRIASPIDGILLNRYKEAGELAAAGQPLFKVADLDTLILRAYVSGNQLGDFTLGQEVTVRVDAMEGLTSLAGRLIWVSSSAEFTPKVIQTRDERVSLVYAIKVEVPNDGRLKIGMPGEVMF
ncbi:MAG: HlyD family efflux transporter periplasmic adaptor subunit [Bacteroidales bacterium]